MKLRYSNNVLSDFNLLGLGETEFEDPLYSAGKILNIGTFCREDNRELFERLEIKEKYDSCTLYIENMEPFCFYNEKGEIAPEDIGAPVLKVGYGGLTCTAYILTKNDLCALAELMIQDHQLAIHRYKKILSDIENSEN